MVILSIQCAPGPDNRPSRRRRWPLFWRLDAARCLLLLLVVFAGPVSALESAVAQELPEYPECVPHLWATGSHLGRAEAIAGQDAQSEDAAMLEDMHEAGKQIEQANKLCGKNPLPWPAWPNWHEVQDQLAGLTDKFQNGQIDRKQLAIELYNIHQSLSFQLAVRVMPTYVDRDSTCVEIYMRLAVVLSLAEETARIFHRLTPEAALHLRKAVSLIYQTRGMPTHCLDFKGLLPAIDQVLKTKDDPLVVDRLNDIVHASAVVAVPHKE
jgi:hypothetical protein